MAAEVDDVGLVTQQVALQIGHPDGPLLLDHELVPQLG